MNNGIKDLDLFFYPRSIAIVGASEALNSYGARYIQALLDFGYTGRIYAVNHNGNEVLGYKIYRTVLDIPDSVDLAAICVPNRFVPEILRSCVKKQIPAAIVLSAGFSESGEEGRRLEQEIVEIAAQGIRVMGPNCFGTYCPAGGITIVPGGHFPREGGGIALIAQSGQLSEGITGRSFGEGIRFSKVASYGNACNINEADLLEYLMQDKETRVFSAYLEGVKNGKRFFEIARQNDGKKPVVLWKVGLTRSGSAAATSHTGSMAGGSTTWDAFFRQTHAIKINTMEELIDTNVGFSCLPSGCGKRVALVSGGGAGTVIGADACENAGLLMPAFSAQTENQLRAVLPAVGTSVRNPLDIGNPHPPLAQLNAVLEAVASDENIDVIVIRRIFFSIKVSKFFSGTAAPSFEEQEQLLQIPISVKNKYQKPIVIILTEELTGVGDIDLELERRKIRDYFFSHGIPVYLTEHRAFTALANLSRFKERVGRPVALQIHTSSQSRQNTALSKALKDGRGVLLDEIQSKEILKEAGINVTETVIARSKEEAVKISQTIGFPVVMKIVSPQITHKSDVGGVKLGLKTARQVEGAYDDIISSVRRNVPDALIEGVAVQQMARSGVELVIGATKDPQFGYLIMFGLGGTLVEVLQDVAFRISPLTGEDAAEMIRQVKCYRLLKGFRGQPPVDIAALENMLLKVSSFVENNPVIKELDINPIIAYSDGAVAVDARIIVEREDIQH